MSELGRGRAGPAGPAPTDPAAFLSGLSVLELGDGVAGSAATAELASYGAAVTKVVDPTSPHRRSRPRAGGPGAGSAGSDGSTGTSLLAAVLDRGKTVLTAAEAPEPASHDVVVVDRVGATAAGPGPAEVADYLDWVRSANARVWVTISAFGLDGPDRGQVASELVVGAAAGAFVLQSGTDRPLKLAGWQALRSAGQVGALAACHGLDLVRRRGGSPVHLDVSAQESAISMGPVLWIVHLLLGCSGSPGGRRYGAPAGFFPCTDGLLRISAMEDHQWQSVVRAMGYPDWALRFDGARDRIEHAEEVDEGVGAWTSGMTRAEAEHLLQAAGVPATGMYSPAEILASPQLAHRGTLVRAVVAPGVEVSLVDRPFLVERPPPATGARRRPGAGGGGRGLAGLRVLEAGHVLAMPLAGSLLGAMGASVTKLEDLDRLDMYRRRAPFIDGVPGIDRAAYFAMVNHSKQSLAARFEQRPDLLAEATSGADVVLENLGARRARRLGLDAASLGAARPGVLAVSSSGFGQTGPLADYRAYAYNLQSACGLGYLTRDEEGRPAHIDIAWADLISGYAVATLVAAWAVGPAGGDGAAVDFAMADLISSRFDEHLAAASRAADYEDQLDRANEQLPFAPNGCYRTAERWLALSVEGDRQWEALRTALGSPRELADPRFADQAGRIAHRDRLDNLLSSLLAGADGAGLAGRLQGAGVPASTVRTPADLVGDDHLSARGYFTPVEHPEWGRRRLLGLPWREAGRGPFPLHPPPLLQAPEPVAPEGA